MPGKLIELYEVAITHLPKVNGLLHEAEVMEVQVHPDDAISVIGVIAALDDPGPGICHGRNGLIERLAQGVTTLRNGKGVLILQIVTLIMRDGV